jgi:hypothetical protein
MPCQVATALDGVRPGRVGLPKAVRRCEVRRVFGWLADPLLHVLVVGAILARLAIGSEREDAATAQDDARPAVQHRSFSLRAETGRDVLKVAAITRAH